MNLITLLLILAVLALLACAVTFLRPFGREECHNSEEPAPPKAAKGKKAESFSESLEPTEAEKEVADLTPSATPAGIPEAEIAAKVAMGLTRDQAIEVIKSQRAHDKLLAMKG